MRAYQVGERATTSAGDGEVISVGVCPTTGQTLVAVKLDTPNPAPYHVFAAE